MCAMEHEVVHRANSSGLYVGPDGQGYEIAVMLRTNVFSASRARKMKGKPTPTDVYDLVNAVVAKHIANEPLTLPSFVAVAGRPQSCSEGSESGVVESATKIRRRK